MNHYDFSVSFARATAGSSSLLIPDMHMVYFRNRCDRLGGQAQFLKHLVQKYLPLLPLLKTELNEAREPNWNTCYQAQGQNLVKKNFKPAGQDWEAFRNAALACGVSMCFLFVFLMHLEQRGFFQKIRHPRNSLGLMEGNSLPSSNNSLKHLKKFSKLSREFDIEEQILHRKIEQE